MTTSVEVPSACRVSRRLTTVNTCGVSAKVHSYSSPMPRMYPSGNVIACTADASGMAALTADEKRSTVFDVVMGAPVCGCGSAHYGGTLPVSDSLDAVLAEAERVAAQCHAELDALAALQGRV